MCLVCKFIVFLTWSHPARAVVNSHYSAIVSGCVALLMMASIFPSVSLIAPSYAVRLVLPQKVASEISPRKFEKWVNEFRRVWQKRL
jgi:hypothetical protein